jgi:hypothetical protein
MKFSFILKFECYHSSLIIADQSYLFQNCLRGELFDRVLEEGGFRLQTILSEIYSGRTKGESDYPHSLLLAVEA